MLSEDELHHLEEGVLCLFAFESGLKGKEGAECDVGIVWDIAIKDGLEVFGFGEQVSEAGKAVASV